MRRKNRRECDSHPALPLLFPSWLSKERQPFEALISLTSNQEDENSPKFAQQGTMKLGSNS